MAKTNGKNTNLDTDDLERELPTAPDDGYVESPAQGAQTSATPSGELQKLKEERDQLFDRLARLQAEFDNYRKRSAREQQDFRDYALANAVGSLLPVMDSLDLALKNSAGEKSEVRSGVELVRKQFADALAKLGLREVPAEGEPFDPQYHQAIEMVESDQVPDHHVLQALQRGYKLKDRLIRPAMVRVARNSKQ
ncbi:MAG TPA: nucleotide exchange factor GrpE [Terriglobales bacterium]|jgi:molecular chaperone GrpE|nr:nucleotide exchange factor GrpE [Terriglobales bacterium]